MEPVRTATGEPLYMHANPKTEEEQCEEGKSQVTFTAMEEYQSLTCKLCSLRGSYKKLHGNSVKAFTFESNLEQISS